MEDLYPANPLNVPADLTKPTSAYRNRAWMAMAGLLLFVAMYVALTYWFAHTAWRLLSGAMNGGGDAFIGFIAGICAAFLTVFMAKAIFFVKHSYQIDDIEITAQEQPKLFAFLNRLADEAGAPRPHRVFLSPRVNAAVFYDLSIVNLFLPSKKNLEIGLGLVNVLTLGELKAVLAHEFGHFAQRSMAVGRWVYIAQQIAGHIISKRDALDKILDTLSRVDFRIAWVGWLLRIVIWSIRSVMETMFRLVLLAQRALSREMEFQADLVAVSLTGSDAIVHALHRLNIADTAWDRAAQFAASQAHSGKIVRDVFAAQDLVIEKLRTIWDTPSFRDAPSPPTDAPEKHRIFKSELAQPPRMWSTHPGNDEREGNAKRNYVGANVDGRSAWELFSDSTALKERMSAHIVRDFKKEKPDAQIVPIEESLAKLSEQYTRAYLQPQYRGAYLGRSIARHASSVDLLYGAPAAGAVHSELSALYPESLTADLDQLRQLESEKASLQALYEGFLTAPGGIIRHGGKELRRRDLPEVIEKVTAQLKIVEDRVRDHDKRCRGVHLAAAETLGRGWKEYLRGLAQLHHYADHAEANLRDAQGAMHNVYSVVTADGRVSSAELNRLLDACIELYQALRKVHEQAGQVELDRTMTRRLEIEGWAASLEKFELPPPTQENIGQWLPVIDGWVNSAAGALTGLQLAALEQLLLTEAQVANFVNKSMQPNEAPSASRVPDNYVLLLPGNERKRQKRLGWWDKFQVADGVVATLARLGVAAAIVLAVVSVGGSVGNSSVIVYNGLDREVRVRIGDSESRLAPFGKTTIDIENQDKYSISTTTSDGEAIERFETDASEGFTHYVYNVAGATPLVEWTAVYGSYAQRPERLLGAVRWTTSSADHVFEEPPQSINTKGGGGMRTVLSAAGNESPSRNLELVKTDDERLALITAHARWDATNSKHALYWLSMAASNDKTASVVTDRLKTLPLDPLLLRLEQDMVFLLDRSGDRNVASAKVRNEEVCSRHRELLAAHPGDSNLVYVVARCIEDEAQRDAAFVSGSKAAPDNGWLAQAAGYVHSESSNWDDALRSFERARTLAPATLDLIGMDIARVRRVSKAQANLGDLYSDVSGLRFMEEVDANTFDVRQVNDPEALAYAALAAGDLDRAISKSRGTQREARFVRLVGASANATAAQVQAATALTQAAGIDNDTAWTAYALALREHKPTAEIREAIERLSDRDGKATLAFIDGVANGSIRGIEQTPVKIMPRLRGQAYAAAVVLLGNKCPLAWKSAAKRLLFAPERPYLGA